MESHFKVYELKKSKWIEQTKARFKPDLYKELETFPSKKWEEFKAAAIENYEMGDISPHAVSELRELKKMNDETCAEFMLKVKKLVTKGYGKMGKEVRDRLTVDYFGAGLVERELRLAVINAMPLKEADRVKPRDIESIATRAAVALRLEKGILVKEIDREREEREKDTKGKTALTTPSTEAAALYNSNSNSNSDNQRGNRGK